MNTTSRRPLIDVDALMDRLDVNRRWVARAVQEGRIPFVRVGRLLRFDPDAIDRWVEENTRGGAR